MVADRQLTYVKLQMSHAAASHIVMLIASASAQGHGEE
jgi:hypothetical protein